MAIPKIIHTACMGGWKLTALGERCVASWRRVLPDFEIWIWTDANVPDSAWCREAIARKPVNASHWAQWRALHDYGGIFLDNDVEVLRPFDLEQQVFVGFQRADTTEYCINNAVVGAVPRHPLVAEILAKIETSAPDGWPLCSGPGFLTAALMERGLKGLNVEQTVGDVMVYDRERFYPYFHDEPEIPMDRIGPRTIAVHRWEGSWTR
jgi:mannosyltransferase OCH1-like enzyme